MFGLFYFYSKFEPEDKLITYRSSLILILVNLDYSYQTGKYEVSFTHEEIVTNPTLVYKLKNEYNISIPVFSEKGFENETLDDYYLRMADFAKKMEWEKCDDYVLSPFSYLKINMFEDLQENEYSVLENKNIKRLLNKPVEENISPVDMDDFFANSKEVELKNVVDADSGQIEAIVRAKNGESADSMIFGKNLKWIYDVKKGTKNMV